MFEKYESLLFEGDSDGFQIYSYKSKMSDVDKWIEIAKECKYLPENDLKVIMNFLNNPMVNNLIVLSINKCIISRKYSQTFRLHVLTKWYCIDVYFFYHCDYYQQKLCDIVCDLLLEESNIQPVSTPVTVCGDIHGQVR